MYPPIHVTSIRNGFPANLCLSNTLMKIGVSPSMYCDVWKNKVLQDISQNPAPLYPLIFHPLFKDYIWGGRNLEKVGKDLPEGKVAESWEISSHPDGISVIANGAFQGRRLEDLILEMGESILGTDSCKKYNKRFPLLLKLIDAHDWLSIQVHPDDSYAAVHEKDTGKTEVWLVLDAEPGAMILYGLNKEMDREQLEAIIREGRLSQVLRYHRVKKGDMIYIPAGTIHAAGKGVLLAEVQQNSNTTYRLYDYDRLNPDKTARPLHIEKALDAIDFNRIRRNGFVEGLRVCPKRGQIVEYLVADPHFCIQRLTLEDGAEFTTDGRSFHALFFISGHGELAWADGTLPVKSGDSILIPASLERYSIKGRLSMLKSFMGDPEKDMINPLMESGYPLEEIMSKVAGLGDVMDAS